MTTEQINLIKRSWLIFRGIDPLLAGDLFYTRLFASNPSLRKMFPEDMKGQYVKLVDTLTVVVSRLESLETLTEEINAMAQRHVEYGVKPEHYNQVGTALLWTLEKTLGIEYSNEIKDAWLLAYTTLSETMIKAADTNNAENK